MLKTQETELVNFLSTVHKKHIDELIDILTDFGSGRIALNSTVKDILLHEKELSLCNSYCKDFIELIITEFQLFSGNSVSNLFRNKLISYNSILDSVYASLISKGNDTTISEKENSIIQHLLGKNWETKSFDERFKLSTKKSVILKNNLVSSFDFAMIANLGGKIFSRTNPITGLATTIFSFSAEAYRIMIPFILQISWLKMKYGFYKTKYPVKANNEHEIIYFHETKRKVDEKSISNLNHLLNVVPDLLIKRELSNQNYAIINIPLEELTKAKDGNGLRAIVHGNKGIVKNAKIYEPETLQNLVNSGILLNLASTLVAQKHLADISEKLDEINENIKDIKDWLVQERKSKITSAYKEACSVYKYLIPGEKIALTEENVLGNHLATIQSVYEHIKQDLVKFSNDIKGINSIQPNKLLKSFKKYISAYEELKLCCNAILSIYAIFFLSSKDTKNLSKMNDIKDEINDFLTQIGKDIEKNLQKKLNNSKSTFNFNSTDLANIALIQNRKFDFERNFSYSMDKMHKFSDSFLENKSMEIYVSLENKQIKEAYFL